jgi:hypothetical protein
MVSTKCWIYYLEHSPWLWQDWMNGRASGVRSTEVLMGKCPFFWSLTNFGGLRRHVKICLRSSNLKVLWCFQQSWCRVVVWGVFCPRSPGLGSAVVSSSFCNGLIMFVSLSPKKTQKKENPVVKRGTCTTHTSEFPILLKAPPISNSCWEKVCNLLKMWFYNGGWLAAVC